MGPRYFQLSFLFNFLLSSSLLVYGSNVTDTEAWFTEMPQDKFFELGDRLTFDCQCNSFDGYAEVKLQYTGNNGNVFPENSGDGASKGQRIHWGESQKYRSTKTQIYTWKQQLVIENATREDEGIVECTCSNFDSGKNIISTRAKIETHDEVEVSVFVHGEQLPKSTDDVIKVRVTSHASSKDSSGNITLVCKTYTVDTCDDLAWVDRTRNRKIKKSQGSQTTRLSSTLRVGLDNIRMMYGEYQCHCNYSKGDSKISRTVIIGRPPVVPSLREESLVISGETRKSVLYLEDVSDDTYGYPPANPLLWSRWIQLRNGSWVKRSLDFAGTHSNRFIYEASKLVIKNTEYEDAGIYECLIKNDFGNFSFTVSLKVIDKYAAVWPFFGLSIAVIFLMVAIIFFERHTKKVN